MNKKQPEVQNAKLFEDFAMVVAETEQFIKSIASAGGDGAGALRAGVEQGLADATERLAAIREASLKIARNDARAADEYVREDPWRAVRIVAAMGALAGLVTGLIIARR